MELKKREETALMNFKLGIKDKLITDCTDIKQVLETVRSHFMGESAKLKVKASSLSEFEIKEITARENGLEGASAE